MFYHAPIIHDRQSIEDTVAQNTTLINTFEDVIGATITTKDLGQVGTYLIWTPVLVSASLNNTLASFRITIDNVQIGNISDITLKVKELDTGYTFTGTLPDISAGQVLQLQYRTDKGTLTLQEFSIAVDGVPTSRVVI